MQIDAFSYARENICQIMTIIWEVKNNQEPTGWHTKYLSYGVRTYLQTMFLEYVTRRVFFLSHFESLSNNQKLSDLTDHNISIHGRSIILIEMLRCKQICMDKGGFVIASSLAAQYGIYSDQQITVHNHQTMLDCYHVVICSLKFIQSILSLAQISTAK